MNSFNLHRTHTIRSITLSLALAATSYPGVSMAEDRGQYDQRNAGAIAAAASASAGAYVAIGQSGLSEMAENDKLLAAKDPEIEKTERLLREANRKKSEFYRNYFSPHYVPSGDGWNDKKVWSASPEATAIYNKMENEAKSLETKLKSLKAEQKLLLGNNRSAVLKALGSGVGATLSVGIAGAQLLNLWRAGNPSPNVPEMKSVVTGRDFAPKRLGPNHAAQPISGESHQDHPNGVGAE